MKDIFRYLLWVLGVTLWTAVCFIAPDFVDNPVDGWRSMVMILVYVTACGIGSFFLLYVIGCSKNVTAVFLPVWAVVGAALAFYRVGYHITLTPMLIDVTLHTNLEEALGVISWQLIIWVLLNVLVSAWFIHLRWHSIRLPYAWVHGIIALAMGCLFAFSSRRLRVSVLGQRFPYHILYYTREYMDGRRAMVNERNVPAFTPVDVPDSLTIVLVLGEATRADHIQLNGYARETTPRLAVRKNIVTYPHIFSEQTFTEVCMPYLLTRADSVHPELQYTETSFLRVFHEAGYKTAWLSNQDVESSFRHLIAESDTAVFANVGKSVYVYSQWLDDALFPLIDKVYDPRPARSFYVLHTIGSHWYYDNHVSHGMRFFQPTTTSRVVTVNSIDQLVNSYDNTIRYMDYVVDSVISSLEDERAIVIFQSDHGEALGEDGLYLHGHEIEPVQNPACIVWYSDKYAAAYPDKIKALVANKDKRYRTDYLFYSLLWAAGIEADGDNKDMNIFR